MGGIEVIPTDTFYKLVVLRQYKFGESFPCARFTVIVAVFRHVGYGYADRGSSAVILVLEYLLQG